MTTRSPWPKGDTPRERGLRAAVNDGLQQAVAGLRDARIGANNLDDGELAVAISFIIDRVEALRFAQ